MRTVTKNEMSDARSLLSKSLYGMLIGIDENHGKGEDVEAKGDERAGYGGKSQ